MSWSFSLSFCLVFCIEKSQLQAMQVNQLHANSMAPVPVHLKGREEKEVHSHPRARRVSSDENSRTKVGGPECHISTIPELTECLEKRLRLNSQKVKSMVGEGPDDVMFFLFRVCGLHGDDYGIVFQMCMFRPPKYHCHANEWLKCIIQF